MRLRLAMAGLVLCACASAQQALTLDQLLSFVRSAIKLKQPDREVAGYLAKLRLKEKLDERTVEELQGEGAGPKTVAALSELVAGSASLPQPQPKVPKPPPPPIPPPSSEEQQAVISEVRDYAANYSKSLPDFICTQVTRRYSDRNNSGFWQTEDTLTTRLSYFEQKEKYELVMINNHATTRSYHSLGGASSSGEFGSMLQQIFDKDTGATFEWSRWATLRGKRAHVYTYRVAQPNSQWRLNYEKTQEVIVGYTGLIYLGEPRPGQTVLVSDATGPVGCTAGQAARIVGARAVGIAGSPEKCTYAVNELGFAACINDRAGDLDAQVRSACPDGVDVYFDNVGGEVLAGALQFLAPHARVILCGMSEAYNMDTPPPGPSLATVLTSRATLRGIVVQDHLHRLPELEKVVGSWIRTGLFHYREDITDGLAGAPEAFCRLMRGESFGKVLVRVAPEHL